jgi:ubiquinone/menaquinone biosynthesis C-methylase UbiE
MSQESNQLHNQSNQQQSSDQSSDQQIYNLVKGSFGPNAHAYTVSAGHANLTELEKLVERVAPRPTDTLLDIGTGAGHTAIAFAPVVKRVIAYDLTPQMLEEVERNAAAKGITNVETRQGAAEKLPYPDASFELVSCRLTTHHFANLAQALAEMARVLKPGGKLVIMDTTVPDDADLDRQINEIEILRDPSHVRNYPEPEWRSLVEAVGLGISFVEAGYYDEGDQMDFGAWTRRIGTSPENVARLEELFHGASPALTDALKIDLSKAGKIGFALPRITLIAGKPA